MMSDNFNSDLTFEFPLITPSLNKFYSSRNPYWRSKIVKDIKEQVQWTLLSKDIKQETYPFGKNKVDITAICYFKDNRRRDVDNYFPKPIIDALKGFVIIDDDQRYISSCTVRIKSRCEKDKTVIIIKLSY
jgi:Holliday junction resolvase RusA-like endonuclease